MLLATRVSYPYSVAAPHAVWACCKYRRERELRGADGARAGACHWLASLCWGYVCYGFGGTLVADVLLGVPTNLVTHPRIAPTYVAAWLLVWFAPADCVYRAWATPRGLARGALLVGEAVDSVTTPMGRVSRAAQLYGAALRFL